MIRKATAVWAGKATGVVSRITRRGGGTTLPGDIARAIDPHVLTKLSQDLKQGSVVITGTNGKTTTARLISWLLEGAGPYGKTQAGGTPAPALKYSPEAEDEDRKKREHFKRRKRRLLRALNPDAGHHQQT